MATVYGNNTNKSVNTPSDLVDAIDNGAVTVFTDSYEASSLAQNSVIAIAKLPPSAKVKEVILAWDALGASTTLVCGDAADTDRYVTSQNSSVAGLARLNAIAGMDYSVSSDDGGDDTTVIQLTLGGGTGTGTITSHVLFTT
ncbi:MAG: hypothetical protein ACTSX7_19745 [Alphaproteobacteria bacterium]